AVAMNSATVLASIAPSSRGRRARGLRTELDSRPLPMERTTTTAGSMLVARSASEGEKVPVAFAASEHESVGVDVVHRGVNELLAAGATPRGFAFRLLAGEIAPEIADEVAGGAERACRGGGFRLLERAIEIAPALREAATYVATGSIV